MWDGNRRCVERVHPRMRNYITRAGEYKTERRRERPRVVFDEGGRVEKSARRDPQMATMQEKVIM